MSQSLPVFLIASPVLVFLAYRFLWDPSYSATRRIALTADLYLKTVVLVLGAVFLRDDYVFVLLILCATIWSVQIPILSRYIRIQ